MPAHNESQNAEYAMAPTVVAEDTDVAKQYDGLQLNQHANDAAAGRHNNGALPKTDHLTAPDERSDINSLIDVNMDDLAPVNELVPDSPEPTPDLGLDPEEPGDSRASSGFTNADPEAVFEHGRTFHGYKDGKYYLPNDAIEQDRLDLQHELWNMVLGGNLALAPIQEPKRVLDIGTGTAVLQAGLIGIWAIDFATAYPGAQVIGTDLSRIQPENAAPPNCTFERDDAEDEWVLPGPFDYIHLRMMFMSFDDHKSVMGKIFANLKPGAYVEYHDATANFSSIDGSSDGSALDKWYRLMTEGGHIMGRDFNVARKYKTWLAEVGFEDIHEHEFLMPFGPWLVERRGRDVGKWFGVNACRAFHGLSIRVLNRGLGMDIEEIEELVSQAKDDVWNQDIRCFVPWLAVYARKPELKSDKASEVEAPVSEKFVSAKGHQESETGQPESSLQGQS